jgi:hypothetical protein
MGKDGGTDGAARTGEVGDQVVWLAVGAALLCGAMALL